MAWIRVYGGQRSLALELTILSFFFLETELQMPHGGDRRSYKNSNAPLRDNTKIVFSSE